MRRGRRMQAIKGFGRDIDRRHESECQLGRSKVVIDRLWNTYHRKAAMVELFRYGERSFTAENYQRLDPEDVEIRKGLADWHLRKEWLTVDHLHETTPVPRAEDRASPRKNPAHAFLR